MKLSCCVIDCFSDAFDLVGQSRLITSLFLVVTGMHDDVVVRNDFFCWGILGNAFDWKHRSSASS
jgi:hypothetical protein